MVVPNATALEDTVFMRKLQLAATEIKAEAAGRTCGSCSHFEGAWCSRALNRFGLPVKVYGPEAVACREHERRCDA